MATSTFKFSLNTWQHLYSLQQAVQQTTQLSANRLLVNGVVRNEALFNQHDIPIQLGFTLSPAPQYQMTSNHQIILGQLSGATTLRAEIQVTAAVFNELKQNLIEYIGIEGIHIVITIGLSTDAKSWRADATADIVQLDYAMKGDGGT